MWVVQDAGERRRSDAVAIARICLAGRAFELDGDQAYIERIYRAEAGTGGGVVVLRFDVERCSPRTTREAMLVRTFVEIVHRGSVRLLPEGAAFLQIMRRMSDRDPREKEIARRAAVVRQLEIDARQSADPHGRRRRRRQAHEDLVDHRAAVCSASTGSNAMTGPVKSSRATGE